jgi:hypothetical protein
MTFDDSSYYLDGARFIAGLYDRGVTAIASEYWRAPPHSPLSTGMAFVGFLIFGITKWSGYAVGGLVLACFVRFFLGASSTIPLGYAILLVIGLLAAPYFGQTVMWFRPDMIVGLLMAAGSLLIVVSGDWVVRRRTQLLSGVFFGLALLAKPSVFHLTFAVFGVAFLLASVPHVVRKEWRLLCEAWLVTGLLGVLVALPHYYIAATSILTYIWDVVFGAQAEIWTRPVPFWQSAKFYFVDPNYGWPVLGYWYIPTLFVGLVAVVARWVRSEPLLWSRCVAPALLLLATYLLVTIPSFKGPHGFVFAALLISTAALGSVYLTAVLPKPVAWVMPVAILLFGITTFVWPFQLRGGQPEHKFMASQTEILDRAFSAIEVLDGGKVLLETTPSLYLNYTNIALKAYQEGQKPLTSASISMSTDESEIRDAISRSDAILAFTPEYTMVFDHLPSASPEVRALTIRLIEESGRFGPPTVIEDKVAGGAALIYKVRGEPPL